MFPRVRCWVQCQIRQLNTSVSVQYLKGAPSLNKLRCYVVACHLLWMASAKCMAHSELAMGLLSIVSSPGSSLAGVCQSCPCQGPLYLKCSSS